MAPLANNMTKQLYPYQAASVQRWLEKRSLLVSYETGLGKSAVAVRGTGLIAGSFSILRASSWQRTQCLVVCPSIVKPHWAQQFLEWWPEGVASPTVHVIERGKDIEGVLAMMQLPGVAHRTDIVIVSYNLLGDLLNEAAGDIRWNIVVLDESHCVKDRKSKRSKQALALMKQWPSYRLLLTATPIANEPKDLWHQLKCLGITTVGGYWAFVNKFCNVRHDGNGWIVNGLNKDNTDELERLVSSVSDRVTKKEVAHLLPPIATHTVLLDRTLGAKEDWLKGLVEGGGVDGKLWVWTYHHNMADSYAQTLRSAGVDCVAITGAATPEVRLEAVERAVATGQSVVATMDCLGIGVDLTEFNTVVFAELYGKPATIIQAIGRFHRLSGDKPVTMYLPIVAGSSDERVVAVLSKRLGNLTDVLMAGASEQAVLDAINTNQSLEKELEMALTGVATFTW